MTDSAAAPGDTTTPTGAADAAPVVVDVPEHHRYEIRVDDEAGGFAHYTRVEGRYVFDHTVIEPAFEGRGLGSQLARASLADVRAHGEMVVPLCPFIAAWIHKHPDHEDLVDHQLLQRLSQSG